MVTLLFFGRLADIAGGGEHSITLPPDIHSLADLRALISKADPALGDALSGPNVRAAINKTIAPLGADLPISDGDEIAFMPPMSGG